MKCVVKVANKATIDEKTKRHAIEIMEDVTNREISAGKNPMGLATPIRLTTNDIFLGVHLVAIIIATRFFHCPKSII